MNTPIVAICPAGVVTGGPEATHQLVDMANQVSPGIAYICYSPFDRVHNVPDAYSSYRTPVIGRQDIPDNALVVIPEIWPDLIEEFAQPCALWWLSVDSFWSWSGNVEAMKKAVVQLAQSEYARLHIEGQFGIKSLMLTDYINVGFERKFDGLKLPRISVNPSKGRDLIDQFRESCPYVELVELAGLSREDLHTELSRSAIYIDFGHHPGRDRVPREAVLSGAVVLTTRFGSAANGIDMPLDDWYKFDSVLDLEDKMLAIFNDFNSHVSAQKGYLRAVESQRRTFQDEVTRLLYFAEIREMLGGDCFRSVKPAQGG